MLVLAVGDIFAVGLASALQYLDHCYCMLLVNPALCNWITTRILRITVAFS